MIENFRPKDFFPEPMEESFKNISTVELLKLRKKSSLRQLFYHCLTILVIVGLIAFLIIGYIQYSTWMGDLLITKMIISVALLCVLFQAGALKFKRQKRLINAELSKKGYTL